MSQHTRAAGRTCNVGVLGRLLEEGVEVMSVNRNKSTLQYLKAHSKISSTKCTALNVDERVGKQFSLWTNTVAYGDSLIEVVEAYVSQLHLIDSQKQDLKILRTAFNYNGYGEQLNDLRFSPADRYTSAVKYRSLFTYIDGDAYQVSIRVAKNNPVGADTLEKNFGGGGRERAAGTETLLDINMSGLLSYVM